MISSRKSLLCASILAASAVAFSANAFAGEEDGDRESPGMGRGHSGAGPGHGSDSSGNGGSTAPGNSGNAPGHTGQHPGGGSDGHGPRLHPNSLSLCPDSDASLVGPEGQSGRSQVAHVNFSLVDASGESADGDAWARMTYFWVGSSFDFVFNAHQLEPASEWTLVVAADDGTAVCLGHGTVNGGGQLHLLGSVDPEASFPQDLDPFAPRTADTEDATARLVPSDTVDCAAGTVTAGEGNVLESDDGIRFVDVDVLVCPS
jgi:hypothetical protein